jgi:hypothetical protein
VVEGVLRQGTLKTQETFEILRDKIDVRQYRNTTMIEIRVYSRNKAGGGADCEQDRGCLRERLWGAGAEGCRSAASRKVRRRPLAEQQRRVANLQRELDKIRAENRITDLMIDSYSVGTLEAQAVQRTDSLADRRGEQACRGAGDL